MSKRGLTLVHYNAKFNAANNYTELKKIKDVKVLESWIADDASIKQEEGIRSVPTMILYNNGKEVKRWEVDISIPKVPFKEIQEVDELTEQTSFSMRRLFYTISLLYCRYYQSTNKRQRVDEKYKHTLTFIVDGKVCMEETYLVVDGEFVADGG